MWIITNKGLLSIVAHKDSPEKLLVRSRRYDELLDFVSKLPEAVSIYQMNRSDYKWRCDVDRDQVAFAATKILQEIDYFNFKRSIPETDLDLQHFAGEVWLSGYMNLSGEP